MEQLLNNPLALIILCIGSGTLIGKLEIRNFGLGSSATLFSGLGISYFYTALSGNAIQMPNELFQAALIGFIAAVGLKASRHIRSIIKQHGVTFLFLGSIITITGALVSYGMIRFFSSEAYALIGAYVGAMTSSPGLGAALELSGGLDPNPESIVGLGYSIAYIPGIVAVILYARLMGNDSASIASVHKSNEENTEESPESFSIGKLMFVILAGMALGSLQIPLPFVGAFSLGSTGGVLISTLLCGSYIPNCQFSDKALSTIQELSLHIFLAVVGLGNGYAAIQAIADSGLLILVAGILAAGISLTVGHIFGKYVFKLDPSLLTGSVCGGMTSTPGLAAAMDSFQSDDVVVGYGATYPFALLSLTLLTNFLFSVHL
ncbi:MAG: YidE/YbjL duplication [Tindallia sp. MSAO_Bac2]|nr:MAG: YidE/YbjL duplication [Tindallia sp. MSAO_Bac2]